MPISGEARRSERDERESEGTCIRYVQRVTRIEDEAHVAYVFLFGSLARVESELPIMIRSLNVTEKMN